VQLLSDGKSYSVMNFIIINLLVVELHLFLFWVCKEFGAFLYSLLCIMLRSSGALSFFCLCYMCVCVCVL
jgi:hypothetical protein